MCNLFVVFLSVLWTNVRPCVLCKAVCHTLCMYDINISIYNVQLLRFLCTLYSFIYYLCVYCIHVYCIAVLCHAGTLAKFWRSVAVQSHSVQCAVCRGMTAPNCLFTSSKMLSGRGCINCMSTVQGHKMKRNTREGKEGGATACVLPY